LMKKPLISLLLPIILVTGAVALVGIEAIG